MAHSIHEGRYLFQNNPIQKYPKLKELTRKGTFEYYKLIILPTLYEKK